MKRVTNISLAGIAFSIEEDAYEILSVYLAAIESHFAPKQDGKEILTDIESGIAEKLSTELKTPQNAVTLSMIEGVIEEMGRVEDIIGEGGSDETEGEAQEPESTKETKRLFRDTDNAIIGGVAAGIANYFNVDPVFIRLAFVLAAFVNGLGILAYLLLWIIVPAAKTTTEKYQMRGEPVTLSHIARQIQRNVDMGVENSKNGFSLARLGAFITWVLRTVFSILGRILRFVFRIARYLVALGLVVGGAVGIAALTSIFTLMFFVISPETTDPITRAIISELRGNTAGALFLMAGFAAAVIPLVVAVLAGVSLCTLRNRFDIRLALTLGIAWIISFSLALSALLALLPTLSATTDSARETYLSEERIWHDVPLENAPESVLVRGHVSLHLIEDEEVSLRILASDDAFREVHVSEYGRSLEIDRDVHFRLCFFCGVYAPYVVELHAPNVEELAVRGDGTVLIEGITGDALGVALSGAFDFLAEDLALSDLTFTARGAHNAVLLGRATNVVLDVSGASDVFANALAAETISLDASGAHTIRVNPSKMLSGDMSGGNTVRYIETEGLEIDVGRHPESANTLKPMEPESAERTSLVNQIRTSFE